MSTYLERVEGTSKWLKNHRRMLLHMKALADRQEAEAASAADIAARRVPNNPSSENRAASGAANHQAQERLRNLEWQRKRIDFLDNRGVILKDKGGEPRYLNQFEISWNRQAISQETPKAWEGTGMAAAACASTAASACVIAPATVDDDWTYWRQNSWEAPTGTATSWGAIAPAAVRRAAVGKRNRSDRLVAVQLGSANGHSYVIGRV